MNKDEIEYNIRGFTSTLLDFHKKKLNDVDIIKCDLKFKDDRIETKEFKKENFVNDISMMFSNIEALSPLKNIEIYYTDNNNINKNLNNIEIN